MSSTHRRGQAAIEFMVVISFVLVFFFLMQSYIANQRGNADSEYTAVLASRLAHQWATTLELATYSNGFNATLTTPAALDYRETAYTLTIRNSSVSILWLGDLNAAHEVLVPLQTISTFNAYGATAFNLSNGVSYHINGSNGVVWVV